MGYLEAQGKQNSITVVLSTKAQVLGASRYGCPWSIATRRVGLRVKGLWVSG